MDKPPRRRSNRLLCRAGVNTIKESRATGQEMIARRETRFLPDGTYLFQDQLDVNGIVMAKVVTCTAWLLEMYALRTGDLFFMKGKTPVHPGTRRFGVLYPPFSI